MNNNYNKITLLPLNYFFLTSYLLPLVPPVFMVTAAYLKVVARCYDVGQ